MGNSMLDIDEKPVRALATIACLTIVLTFPMALLVHTLLV